MQKRLLNALGFIFAAITGLCVIPNAARAAVAFTDDFEGYSLGYTTGTVWANGANGNKCRFVNTARYSGTQSMSCSYTAGYYNEATRTTATVDDGEWFFWVNVNAVQTNHAWIKFLNGSSECGALYFAKSGTSVEVRGCKSAIQSYASCASYDVIATIPMNTWTNLGFKWDISAGKFWYSVNGVLGNEIAKYGSCGSGIGGMDIFMQDYTNSAATFYIDDISGTSPIPPVVAGFYPILTPTAPVSGETNTVDFDDFDITGSISIPSDNTYIWKKLYATFTNTKGIDSVTAEITLNDLAAGDSFNYSATSSIANATSTDVYSVSYSAWGYWCDPLQPDYCGKLGLSYPFEIEPTYISEGSSPAGGIAPIVVSQWTPPVLEDCTIPTYSILERLTCQIQNALLGLVIPSSSSVNNLFAVFQSFQQKFPFSYVNEIATTFNTVRAALNESATISVKVFGQSGNISLAFWSTPATIAGVTTTIGATIKVILTFFLLLIFLAWGIGYLHRIL
jgi:hypothetical protein